MVRIGILLTLPGQEKVKSELLSFSKLDLAKFVDRKFSFARDEEESNKAGKYGIPTDVATGAYIQHVLKHKDVEVDCIMPKEISKERLRSNDLNFLLVYDVLEAFHTDKAPGKPVYNNLKKCLLEAKNVYPPRKYQEFIYSKINYYNYLQDKKVNVLPTFTMTTEEYRKLGHANAMKRALEWWEREDLGDVLVKPVYGQEGKDIWIFRHPEGKDALGDYFRKYMNKYPGLVVQQLVENFGNNMRSPELRMYYLGNQYKYSACALGHKRLRHPKAEGGTLDIPVGRLKKVTQKILKKLPPIVMPNGVRLPRLITRLDMGYKIDGTFQPFVNEVEFVPSLYAEHKGISEAVDEFIAQCAKQMVRITRHYVKKRQGTGKHSVKRGLQASRRVRKQHVLKRRQRCA